MHGGRIAVALQLCCIVTTALQLIAQCSTIPENSNERLSPFTLSTEKKIEKSQQAARRQAAIICPRPLTFELLTLKVTESRVTWSVDYICVINLVFPCIRRNFADFDINKRFSC